MKTKELNKKTTKYARPPLSLAPPSPLSSLLSPLSRLIDERWQMIPLPD